MKKLLLISVALILTITAFSQSQKERLKSFTKKGNSYLGFELSTRTSAVFGSTINVLSLGLNPGVKYQYNVANRLSIGGGVSTEIGWANQRINGEDQNTRAYRVSASFLLQYYPFKKNGFYVETEFKNEAQFTRARMNRSFNIGFHPGYTFVVGKNRNIGLDIKMNMFHKNRGLHNFPGRPTIGVKIPLGKARKQMLED